MHKIKLRAWDEKEKRFYHFPVGQGHDNFTRLGIYDRMCLDGVEFEHFTGLKDKDGKEIYEGDIVIIHELPDDPDDVFGPFIGPVIFENGSFEVSLSKEWYGNKIMSMYSPYDDRLDSCEVTGNIHETPELLD